MDYLEAYNKLGNELLTVIERMKKMERGLQKKPNESITKNGGAQGTAAKIELRLSIMKEEANAITNAIKVIKPLADLEDKLKEVEGKNKQLEQVLKQLEEEEIDG